MPFSLTIFAATLMMFECMCCSGAVCFSLISMQSFVNVHSRLRGVILMHVAAGMGLLLFTMQLMQETAIILRNGLSGPQVIGVTVPLTTA